MEKKNTILKALFELKKEVGKMSKDSVNPFYKSKYFDVNQLLEHLEPLAEKNGLLILQPIKAGFVRTEIHLVENGEMVFSEIELTGIKDAQKVGSEVTYFRRYTLQSLLSIQAEDDDANKTKPVPQKAMTVMDALSLLESSETITELNTNWSKVKIYQTHESVINKAKELKKILS